MEKKKKFKDTSRYEWDFNLNYNEWCFIDTTQDASYFGMWVNPFRLEFITYCEGDITEIKAQPEEFVEFSEYVKEAIDFYYKRGYKPAIDSMCERDTEKEKLFEQMGLTYIDVENKYYVKLSPEK